MCVCLLRRTHPVRTELCLSTAKVLQAFRLSLPPLHTPVPLAFRRTERSQPYGSCCVFLSGVPRLPRGLPLPNSTFGRVILLASQVLLRSEVSVGPTLASMGSGRGNNPFS